MWKAGKPHDDGSTLVRDPTPPSLGLRASVLLRGCGGQWLLLRFHRGWRVRAEIELQIRLRSLCSATAEVVRWCPLTWFSGFAFLRGMALGELPSLDACRKQAWRMLLL